jgi:hypothetical protein
MAFRLLHGEMASDIEALRGLQGLRHSHLINGIAGPNSGARGSGRTGPSSEPCSSVLIAENLVGYDRANPIYQHGFGIVLGEESQSYIILVGGKNSLEFACPADICM